MAAASRLQVAKWLAVDVALGAALGAGLTYGTIYAYQQLQQIRHLTRVRLADQKTSATAANPDDEEFDVTSTTEGGLVGDDDDDDDASFWNYDSADGALPNFFGRATQNAIPLQTVEDLGFSPNSTVSESARQVVIERLANSEQTWRLMVANIAGLAPATPEILETEDAEERRGKLLRHRDDMQERALVALRYLYIRHPVPERERTMRAVVRSLRLKLPEVLRRRHAPDTDWMQRSQAETEALFVVRSEVCTNLDAMLDEPIALVPGWLARYPFGGRGATDRRKQEVVHRLIHGLADDAYLSPILVAVSHSARGRQQLHAAGLIASLVQQDEEDIGFGRVAAGIGNPDVAESIAFFAPPPTPPGEQADGQPRRGEDEEARARRRRRNTVVAEPSADDQINGGAH